MGGFVLLPPGEITVEYGRGPEYRVIEQKMKVELLVENTEIRPECFHQSAPQEHQAQFRRLLSSSFNAGSTREITAGTTAIITSTPRVVPITRRQAKVCCRKDMFLYVKGEALNVGCCLTWGPCYDYQHKFFDPKPWERSEPFSILKYDVEVSGFGSQALGHVCLLNLRDQTFPSSEGTKLKGWPTWTTPLMRQAKEQGAVTGYAHSANGLGVNPPNATRRLFARTRCEKRVDSSPKSKQRLEAGPCRSTICRDRCQWRWQDHNG